LFRVLEECRFTTEAPTKDEHILYFEKALCDEGHEVLGRMFVSPDGKRRYPVAVCQDERHKDVLVQFPPYYCGFDSAKIDSKDGELTKVATVADKYWELTLVNPRPEEVIG